MNHNMHHEHAGHVAAEPRHTVRNFLPLVVIFLAIIFFTLARQWISGWHVQSAMNDFMAGFFLIFGGFKILKLHAFAEAYATYDIIAKRSMVYAYLYPFIEIGLGVAYLLRLYPTLTNGVTLVLMLVGSIGVALELAKGRTIVCACLGTVFKFPMTYVTLFEDLLMAGMALAMLVL